MRKMKKILTILLMSIICVPATGCEKEDRAITLGDLPANAQTFITTHFGELKVALVTRDSDLFEKSYDVIFSNGSKVEFNGKGEWKSVDCKYDKVPDGIIPAQILSHVNENFPDNFIVEIDRDTRDYEVQLDNDMELKFDLQFNLIGYDD